MKLRTEKYCSTASFFIMGSVRLMGLAANAVPKRGPVAPGSAGRLENMKMWNQIFCLVVLVFGLTGCGLTDLSAPFLSSEHQPAPVQSGEPPTAPMLRVESGMHTAPISRIAVDRAGRYVVTASSDKTARVWDLTNGRLLQTLRPPIGLDAHEGQLYAIVISPDGDTVAVAGRTGYAWDGNVSIYLFDRASGKLRRRLGGMPDVIHHLAWSADGRHLAVALWSDGIRVFRTQDWQQVMADQEYGNLSLWADFDAKGRLVTSCLDGYIRLYDTALKPIAKLKAPGGKEPVGVVFSPDGRRIAVGFGDSNAVNVLDGTDLTHLYTPSTTGVDKGNLNTVAWSADGRWLYAGGRYATHGSTSIRRWAEGGKGKFQDFPAASDILMDLRTLADGRMLFGAGDPQWGVMDKQGDVILRQSGGIGDFRGSLDAFRISHDGGVVEFGLEYGRKRPTRFSLTQGGLELSPKADANLTSPRTEAPRLVVSEWEDKPTPKLNGQSLILKQYERSRSLAIAPDGKSFLLGTNWFLRHFDRQGQEKWQISVPGVVWGVNISGDGRLAVAAMGDGTIRWYRMEDGHEVLALFPHNDGKRWVAWTPSGYYHASPGGEELIGWHVNQGKDQAGLFYAASRFRDTFSRPDVVARILETGEEEKAVHLANAARTQKPPTQTILDILPPVISLISPQDGSEFNTPQIKVRYQTKSKSDAPVTAIKVLLDGRPMENQGKQQVLDGENQELSITLPSRDVEVGLIAENRHGSSAPALAQLKWRGAVQAFVIPPTLYLLAVGVSNYQDPKLKLRYAAKNAVDFAQVLVNGQGGGLYREVVPKVLQDPTRKEVEMGLEWLKKQTTARDVAMLFLSGHGVNDNNGSYFFLPKDGDPAELISSAVTFSIIKDTISKLPGKTLAFLDTCYSGNVMGGRMGNVDITRVVNDLAAAENGVVVFASSSRVQYSLESREWGNGAFTKALIEGLSGKAEYYKDGRITINMLDLYLSERVKELTNGEQAPTTTKPATIPDYPVVMIKH